MISEYWSAIVAWPSSATLDYTTRSPLTAVLSISKFIQNFGSITLSGTHDFISNTNSGLATFGITLPFVQAGFSANEYVGMPAQFGSNLQGSILYDRAVPNIYSANQPEVQPGGFDVVPFLDANNNGKMDPGEQVVQGVSLERPPAGVIQHGDGSFRVTGIEPYVPYYQKISTANVENESLVPKFQSFEVTPPANSFARVEIPLAVGGQIEGYVTLHATGKKDEGLGGTRIKVRHWDPHGDGDTSEVQLSEETLSYSNGEFYYMGIPPGRYRIFIDPNQLRLLYYKCSPAFVDFEVKNSADGDVVNGLNFTLEKQVTASPSGSAQH